MADRRIAVTGATGFVGCRLAERMVLAGGYRPVGLVRRYSGAGLARLARLPIEIVRADVLDREGLTDAFRGCDAVVHCAYGTSGTPGERHRVTVDGTRNVLRAATRAGVGRVIHMSSAAVHGTGGDRARIDETAPFTREPGTYEAAKIGAENAVEEHRRGQGPPVVILRPPLIYGAHGRRWTVRILEELVDGGLLVDGGHGAANLVYIDNLVDAILCALDADTEEDGAAFFTVDDEPLTWRELYEAYAGLLPHAPPLREMTVAEIERIRRVREPGAVRASLVLPLRLLPRLARASIGPPEIREEMKRIPWVRALKEALPEPVVERIKPNGPGGPEARGAHGAAPATAAMRAGGRALTREAFGAAGPPSRRLPDAATIELLTSRTRLDNARAKRRLGWRPRVGFDEAIRRIDAWARYTRIGAPPEPPLG